MQTMKLLDRTFFKNVGFTIFGAQRDLDVNNSSFFKRAKFYAPFIFVAPIIYFLHLANPALGAVFIILVGGALFLLCAITTASDRLGNAVSRCLLEKIKKAAGGSFLSHVAIFKITKADKIKFRSITLAVPLSPPRFSFAG